MNVHVTYVDSKGVLRAFETAPGVSVMEVALQNHVPEVESDCGGVCTCASCHVLVDEAWLEKFAPPSKTETDLLSLLETVQSNSRLSCQLKLSADVDGLVVHTMDPSAST